MTKAPLKKQPEPLKPQPPETEDSKLERAANIAGHLLTAISALESNSDRTHAHGAAEETLAYIQKIIDGRKRDAD